MKNLLQRLLFTLKMGWRHRQQLINFQKKSALQCATILSLDSDQLKAQGIKVLILDFDGVLASHGEDSLPPAVLHWLQTCIKKNEKHSIFILTNRETAGRKQYIADMLPEVQLLHSARKKPYPDGILKILEITKAPLDAVLMVDDRLLTGVLAALIAGVKARWVATPFISIRKRPWQELFFICLRWGERWLFR